MTVRTRFAPSPTGYLHVGGARTALFSWLYARKHGGQFILRIEDTDLERSTQASVNAIFEGMSWLGLTHDEGPFYQTHRLARYKEIVAQLIEQGDAYHCYCSKESLNEMREEQRAKKEKPRYDGRCRHLERPPEGVSAVVRFKNPTEGAVTVKDNIRGEVTFQNTELDDLIIARSDGSPTYNLTVVVDDMDMELTHVIRGDDHLNNSPRQINIFKALNADIPIFSHVPMILGADGGRLSKRHGAVSVMTYRDEGYLPEALLNYLVRLGWSHGDQEIFSIDEMIMFFELDNINKSPAGFNQEKLEWINQEYIKTIDASKLSSSLSWHFEKIGLKTHNGPNINEVIESLRDRSKTLVEMAQSCFMFYKDFTEFDSMQANKVFTLESREVLDDLHFKLKDLVEWSAENIHSLIKSICEDRGIGFGKLGQPFRLALSGDGKAGSVDICAKLVGRERTLMRLQMAIDFIDNNIYKKA